MDYLDLKALNDALARLPALSAEMEALEREIAEACGGTDHPADLTVAGVQLARTRHLLEAGRDRLMERYLGSLRGAGAEPGRRSRDRLAACFHGLTGNGEVRHVQAA